MEFRNISHATVGGLRDIMDLGEAVAVRGSTVLELRNRVTVIREPLERCLFIPGRGNSIFASLAETMWVLAGRDDVAWLQAYLPRAPDFSDDGVVWRGAYGPRLRNWSGVDQLREVTRLLRKEPMSRRAVMTLFDPARDYVASKDVPCNNWLHWLVRGDELHLTVGVRSNDIVWGFSGINSFVWSVLHEALAGWVGVAVGDVTYLASSFHLYPRHDEMAAKAAREFRGVTCYDFGVTAPRFSVPLERLDEVLSGWFEMEAAVRSDPESVADERLLADDFLDGALRLLRLYHGARRGWSDDRLRAALGRLPESDLTAAAMEYFSRGRSPEWLGDIEQPSIRAFWDAYHGSTPFSNGVDPSHLFDAIKSLHRVKDAAYGTAWKKRGEVGSILPNLARKVDRLMHFCGGGGHLGNESVLETAIDLLVYLVKYRLYLCEKGVGPCPPSLVSKPGLSDDPDEFDRLLSVTPWPQSSVVTSCETVAALDNLLGRAINEAVDDTPGRGVGVEHFGVRVCELVAALVRERPHELARFLEEP